MISNTTIVFSIVFQNCYPKHPNKAFFVLNLRIFIFVQNFAFRKIWDWFQLWLYIFQIPSKDTKIRHFCSWIYIFLCLHQILQEHKFGSTDFKYEKSFIKKSFPFFVQNPRIFILVWNFAYWKIKNLKILISKMTIVYFLDSSLAIP